MRKENEFITLVSENLIFYRKAHNLTQLQLAEKLNYSDKSISKWERKESLPDLYILNMIADLYGITINELTQERSEKVVPKQNKINVLVLLISIGLCWLLATIAYVLLGIIVPEYDKAWLAFIYAIPASMIIAIVFSKIWNNTRLNFTATSILNWTVPLSVFLSINYTKLWMLFIISIPLQILIILWFSIKRYLKSKSN